MRQEAVKKHSKTGYIFAIIINAVLLWVFNNLLNWGVPFLTDQFTGVLWAFDFSLAANIVINFLWLIANPAWFRHLGQAVLNVIAVLILLMLFAVFPFTFAGESWAVWVKVACLVFAGFAAIGVVVEFFKLVLGKD